MSYGVRETPTEIEIEIDATDREGVFREALTAAAALSHPGDHPPFERSVPLQAAGDTDQELLAGIVRELLRAAEQGQGALGAPRWLLFEPGRVSATLPLAPGATAFRKLALRAAQVAPGSTKAALILN